jgi:hypothetical protein
VVIGKRYSNESLKALSTIIYAFIQLMAVLSFIPSVKYFIFRSQGKNGKGTFAVDKWPWVLVALNIFRNSSMLAVALA